MKKIKLNRKINDIIEKEFEAFKKIFVREPGPNDPVIFDLDCDFPTLISEKKLMDALVEAAKKAAVDSYKALKHFQFTDEEIEEYFEGLGG